MTTFIIEGLDRLGKSTLIKGIQNELGYHMQFHRQKPELLDIYLEDEYHSYNSITVNEDRKRSALHTYQIKCFVQDMNLIVHADSIGVGSGQNKFGIIFDRSWIGEAVYASLYRGYNGDYVFDLEQHFNIAKSNAILILLTEDFAKSNHFDDDGESFDITKREQEQEAFIKAFNRSRIPNKKMICVTDPETGGFRNAHDILQEVLKLALRVNC